MKRTVPSPLRGILARNLRAIRAHIGWSQERLAAAADLNRTYLSAVERGEQNISIDNIYKLSRALGVDAQHLLDQEAKIVASVGEPKGTGRRSVYPPNPDQAFSRLVTTTYKARKRLVGAGMKDWSLASWSTRPWPQRRLSIS